MRARALIHVGGPTADGKTTFIEAVLESVGSDFLAARCVQGDALDGARESAPWSDPANPFEFVRPLHRARAATAREPAGQAQARASAAR